MSESANDTPLPNFFVIGAAKCGTTALHEFLRRHPEVFMPEDKEPHFFDYGANYRRGVDAWLRQHYAGAEAFAARGEATPSYFHQPDKVIPRLRETYAGHPTPRLICMLRDPVERCLSHYTHMVRAALETEPPDVALAREAARRKEGGPVRWSNYFADGLYADNLRKWFDAFGREQHLVLLNEDLNADPHKLLAEVFAFLGLRPYDGIETSRRHNPRSSYRSRSVARFLNTPSTLKRILRTLVPRATARRLWWWLERRNQRPLDAAERPSLGAEAEAELRARYAPDVTALERLLERDLSHWKPEGIAGANATCAESRE